jgi:hypothetical protein
MQGSVFQTIDYLLCLPSSTAAQRVPEEIGWHCGLETGSSTLKAHCQELYDNRGNPEEFRKALAAIRQDELVDAYINIMADHEQHIEEHDPLLQPLVAALEKKGYTVLESQRSPPISTWNQEHLTIAFTAKNPTYVTPDPTPAEEKDVTWTLRGHTVTPHLKVKGGKNVTTLLAECLRIIKESDLDLNAQALNSHVRIRPKEDIDALNTFQTLIPPLVHSKKRLGRKQIPPLRK